MVDLHSQPHSLLEGTIFWVRRKYLNAHNSIILRLIHDVCVAGQKDYIALNVSII